VNLARLLTREIEEVQSEPPDVAEGTVVRLPHPSLGEGVGAAVAVRQGTAVTQTVLRSTATWALSLARQPRTAAKRLGGLGAEGARIVAGTSTLTPYKRDRRFTDPAWSENPLLRRLVQLYLAGGMTLEQLVADADLDPRDGKRVRFLLENLVEAMAPSNLPLINPASAKAVIDTAGLSLARGGRQLVTDLVSVPRIPEMVDTTGFVLGENIAATPGAVVFRNEVLELLQYRPRPSRSTTCRRWSSRRRSTSSTPSTWPPSAAWWSSAFGRASRCS
jgi:hypothetical protein